MLRMAWQETEGELYERYRHEANGHRKIRLQAFWLLRQGKTEAGVASVVGVTRRTVERWVGWYKQEGLEVVLNRLPGGDHGEKGFLSNEQKQALLTQAEEEGFSTARDAGDWLEKRFGIHYRYKSLHGLLKRVGLRKKVPRPRSDKASVERQESWKKGG